MHFFRRLQFARYADVLGRIPFSRPATISGLQQRRFRALLQRARDASPYYRKRYQGLPDSPSLEQLPVTTKEEMREHFDEVVTDRRIRSADLREFIQDERHLGQWYLGRYAVCHTSGSGGPPLLIVQDAHCLNVILATMASRGRPGKRPGVLEGARKLFAPTRIAAITFRRGFYPSGITLEFTPQVLWPFARVTRLSSVQSDLIARLNALQPHVLSGYASVLEGLALQSSELQFQHLEYITNSSEQLSRRARQRIEEAFGVPVIDHYGTGECLQLADGCVQCGKLHVNADWAILESVDDQNRPVPHGMLGARVLLTNLANTTQPFIRYEVGDRVALAPADGACPNNLPRIERFDGREAELFWITVDGRERFVSGVLFHSAADSLQVVREWRATQTARNRIELQLQLLPGVAMSEPFVRSQLLARLDAYGLPSSVQVEVTFVDALEPDRQTGKMRRMISQIGRAQPEELESPAVCS